jgi:hypothetical protein
MYGNIMRSCFCMKGSHGLYVAVFPEGVSIITCYYIVIFEYYIHD